MKTKPIIIALAALVLVGGVFLWYRSAHQPTVTQYVLSTATRGTIATVVNGTGQVSATDQIDIKPKASGTLLALKVQEGQVVKAGDIIGVIDSTDAQKTVRDAETSLETAKLNYEKLLAPPNVLMQMQSDDAVAQAKANRVKADSDLAKSYDDGYTDVSKAFLNLPDVMQGLHDVLYASTIDKYGGRWNIDYYTDGIAKYDDRAVEEKVVVDTAYNQARASFDASYAAYKATPSTADRAVIAALIRQTYDTARLVSDTVKTASNFIAHYADGLTTHGLTVTSVVTGQQSTLSGFTGTLGGHVTTLLGATTAIQNAKDAITSADRAIAEKMESSKQLAAGADPLDVRAQQLIIADRENALHDARQALADYVIRSPIEGAVAKVGVRAHDDVSSGTVIATIVSTRKYAQISLNEIDAAKLKVGQKASLTFDAIDGLDITGSVATVDPLGAVSQGVVTYGVKIVFDIQDDRIKPSMSVSADVITEVHPDVVTVPNGAVKGVTGSQYVETIDGVDPNIGSAPVSAPNGLRRITVTAGLLNDSDSEIISGLNEGDLIVVRTVSATAAKPAAAAAPSLFGGGGGGGAARAFRGN